MQPTTVRDDAGRQFVTWANVPGLSSVPARVLTGPGREQVAAGTRIADADLRVSMPWHPTAISAAWRIVWNGATYEIVSPPEYDATGRIEVRIVCKLATGGGQP